MSPRERQLWKWADEIQARLVDEPGSEKKTTQQINFVKQLLERAIAAARDEAIEECAKVAEAAYPDVPYREIAEAMAVDIRALKKGAPK